MKVALLQAQGLVMAQASLKSSGWSFSPLQHQEANLAFATPEAIALWAEPYLKGCALALPLGAAAFELRPLEEKTFPCRLGKGPELRVMSQALSLSLVAGEEWTDAFGPTKAACLEPSEIALARVMAPLATREVVTVWCGLDAWVLVAWYGGEPLLVRTLPPSPDLSSQLRLTGEWCEARGVKVKECFVMGPDKERAKIGSRERLVDWKMLHDGDFEALGEQAELLGLALGWGR